jgi:hypothetical protein
MNYSVSIQIFISMAVIKYSNIGDGITILGEGNIRMFEQRRWYKSI